MSIIKTKSFELAVNSAGDKESEKLALLLPGRLDTKDYVNFVSHLDYLASRGYFAVSFDPPGTWESPGDIKFTTTNYIKAVNELIGYFGNKSTILLGHSRGGQVAMLVGTTNSQVIGFIAINASYGPPTPPEPDELKNGKIVAFRDLPPGDHQTTEQKQFYYSLNYFTDGQQYNPVPALKLCTKPKLLIYSTKDQFTKPDEIKKIFNSVPDPKMLARTHFKTSFSTISIQAMLKNA